jgi:hypothetical protein
LFGPDDGGEHRRVEFNFYPCHTGSSDECINKADDTETQKKAKLAETLTYLGQGDLTIVFNSQRKNMQEYGGYSIVNEAHIENRQFD